MLVCTETTEGDQERTLSVLRRGSKETYDNKSLSYQIVVRRKGSPYAYLNQSAKAKASLDGREFTFQSGRLFIYADLTAELTIRNQGTREYECKQKE